MVQFTLPKLLRDVNSFYEQANKAYLEAKAAPMTKKEKEEYEKQVRELLEKGAPKSTSEEEEFGEGEAGDPPYFQDLVDISTQVGDPGLAEQLGALAELYRRAIQIGGGYATIARAINNLKNMYSDGDETDIETILNGMITELAKHAGGIGALASNDNMKFVRQLTELKQEIDQRNATSSEALDSYKENIVVPGANAESEGDLTESGLESETGDVVFDPTAGLGGDRDGAAVNRGWHTAGKLGLYKDWAKYYENEKAAYEVDLAQERNPDISNVLKQLIGVVDELSIKTAEALKLSDQLKVAPDPMGKAQLKALRVELDKIKKIRALLKTKIRSRQLEKENQELHAELGGTRDEKVQMLLKQKIALNELSKSTDVYKAKERNYRLKLVDMMSGGNFPGAEQLHKELQKIEEASKKRIPIEEYRKHLAQQVAKTKQTIRIDPNVRKNIYNWGAMQLDGFITHLSQNILAERKTLKDRILGTKNRNVTEQEKAMFKPYMDAIAAAANAKDKTALVAATRALREQIKKAVRLTPEFTKYLISVRSSKFFYEYRDRLKTLQKMGTELKGGIGETEVQYLRDTIAMGEKLINYYRDLKIWIKGKSVDTGYKTPTNTIELVNNYLANILADKANKTEKINPETGEVTYE